MWIWLRQINRARCYKDKTLNLWSEIIDSKTLDYHRTNPREYQILRTHTKETTWIQDPASPNHQKHPVQDASSKQQTRLKFKPIISRQEYHLTQPCPSEEKQTNKQTNKNSAQILTYMKLTQTTGPNLGGQKPKGRKHSTFFKERIHLSLKLGKRRP